MSRVENETANDMALPQELPQREEIIVNNS